MRSVHSDIGFFHQNQLNNYVRNIKDLQYAIPEANSPEQFNSPFLSLSRSIAESIENSRMKSIEELNTSLELNRGKYEEAGDLLTKKEQAVNEGS